jgi:hypothetical protein
MARGTHRPIVRSFKREFVKEAVAHVRAGGHAVVWEHARRARFVFQRPAEGNEEDFGAWAVYDMGKMSWDEHHVGPFRGLASIPVPRDCLWIVKRRSERDSVHPGPTRRVRFDCRTCAACCQDNEVILQEADVKRFEEAGRGELAKPPFAKRHRDGRVILTLLPSKRCRHLESDMSCGIYEIRPHSCSEFPMGSECCLYAREDMLGVYDGAAPPS